MCPDFVFCHGDLARYSVLVDQDVYDTIAVIDWQFSGPFPPSMELRKFYQT